MIELEFINDQVWKKMSRANRHMLPIAIKIALGKYLNLVREESLRYIIPDRTGLPNFDETKYGHFKKLVQRSHPTRLTSRSGRLIAGLSEGQDIPFQNLTRKVSKTDPNVYRSLNGKITGGGTTSTSSIENFVATWNPFVRIGSDMLKNSGAMTKSRISSSSAKKLAAIRFRHETGIRGHRRNFMEPAHQANSNKLNGLLLESLRKHYIL